jgi:hypothetical protein
MNYADFLTDPASEKEGFDGILYGAPKSGKTSTLDDDHLKVLLIDMEGGSSVLGAAKNVKRLNVPVIHKALQKKDPNITKFEVLQGIWADIESKKLSGFDLYASDSFTNFETIVKEYVVAKYAPKRKREIAEKFGAQSDWGDLRTLLIGFAEAIHDRTKQGADSINHLWLAHSLETKNELTKQPDPTKIMLQGSTTADVIMSIVDGLFYMITQESDGVIKRGVYAQPNAHIVASTRQSKRETPLPKFIQDPKWSVILYKLGYYNPPAKK